MKKWLPTPDPEVVFMGLFWALMGIVCAAALLNC